MTPAESRLFKGSRYIILGGSLLWSYAGTLVCFGILLVFLHLTRKIWLVLTVLQVLLSQAPIREVFMDVMVAF
jgi:hypothetical protein